MGSLIHRQYLQDAADSTDINESAMINGTAVYSKPIHMNGCDGFAFIDFVLADTPDIDVTYEVSYDKTNWKTPYDTDGNDVGVLATALITSRLIVFEPVICEWLRIKIDPDANSTVTGVFGFKETKNA